MPHHQPNLSFPVNEARRLYEKHGKQIEADLADYLRMGCVYSTPHRLMLGRPIIAADWKRWLGLDELHLADCWYVHLAIGQGCKWYVEQMPWHLPRICWRRDFNKEGSGMRFFNTETVKRHLKASI